jgi:hypothetical protein
MMVEEKQGGDEFTAEEQAFFETGGEAEMPAEQPAPENEEQPAVAETQEAGEEEQERDEKGRFVPHGAFHAERERRKELEGKFNDTLQKLAVLEERWKSIQQPAGEEKAEEDPEPDPNKDIFAHNAWLKRQFERERKANEEWRQGQQKTQEQQQQDQQIATAWTRSVQQFQSKEPSFPQAAQFLVDMRTKQLAAFGYNEAQINQAIDAEVKNATAWAVQQGKSPAEAVYEYAKASGFTPQEKPQDGERATDLPDQLKKVEQAQRSARTIASGGGKANVDPDSPEAIASMSDKEFEAWIAKPENERRFQRMMGA